ncbi:phosphatidylinositol-3-phosphatase SAC1-like [Oscarella lobularis]|uniref:phosphatidylinositol-3-phosphatase SAC1-like n=1 Tax=Oscarella lobularis TaxID=121494 RepID=UPI003313F6CB
MFKSRRTRAMAVHERLRLYTTHDAFAIAGDQEKEMLEIDRSTDEIRLIRNTTSAPPTASIQQIFGVVGIIRLIAGRYLIVITKRQQVGQIDGHPIWKITETDVISFSRSSRHLTEIQTKNNAAYLNMVKSVLSTESFYFCTAYDLSHTLQRIRNAGSEFKDVSLFERAASHFVWNRYLLQEISSQRELSRFALPILHGFISFRECVINEKKFQFLLISRRSSLRAGVRYYRRGIDVDGHAANTVETEQIVFYNGAKASFVQVRGSIPLVWSQKPNLSYKPKPLIADDVDQTKSFQKHIEMQHSFYGRLVAIDLINQKGSEQPLGNRFSREAEKLSDDSVLKYHAFDFHHQCKNMRWDKLSILLNDLKNERERMKHFLVDPRGDSGVDEVQQEGIFRTNCLDCLDRTNVVQGLLARTCLQQQLETFGILAVGEPLESHKDFDFTFKNIWADNGDSIAMQYTGTGALKSDFTRTGKRSIAGALQDGYKSSVRYLFNNFRDGFRQDSMDLFLGNYTVDVLEGNQRRLTKRQGWHLAVLPTIFLFVLSMLIISLIIPTTEWMWQLIYILFWGVLIMITARLAAIYGYDLVDSPRLTIDGKAFAL